MRLFYLCYENLSEHRGGSRHVTEAVRHLALPGREIELFVPVAPPAGVFDDRVAIHVVAAPSIRIVGWVLFYILSAWAMIVAGVRRPPDAIYFRETAYNLFPIVTARLLRCPLVIEVNGPLLDEMSMVGAGAIELWLILASQHITYDEADRIVVVAEGLGDRIVALFGVSREKIVVIPNGTDPDRMRPADLAASQQAIGLTPGPVIGFVGSCYPYHDIDTLITAAPAILKAWPDTRFIVVGDGYMRAAWMNRAKEEGLEDHFIFTGLIPYDDVPEYITAFTLCIALFAQESEDRMNRSPMKLYDYMACGRPTIATDLAGIGDVVRRWQAGLTIPSQDAQALAEAAVRLLNDAPLCEDMGRNARRAVDEYFNWGRVAMDIVGAVHETAA